MTLQKGPIVINATANNFNLKASALSEEGVIPWSWQGWNESFVDHELHLVLNGFAAPDGVRSSMNGSRSHDSGAAAILDIYRQKGNEFVKNLRGSFALALWDARQRSLLLATDHFGTRPIYYGLANQRIAFAPCISGFASAAEMRKAIEPNSLYFYLNHSFIPAPFTIFKNIRRLEPGQVLEWADRRSSVRRYWDMAYQEERNLSELAAAELLRE